MKREFTKWLLLVLLSTTTSAALAQENANRDRSGETLRGPYLTGRTFDDLFIGIAGGVNIYEGENDSQQSLGKRLAPAMDLYVGKWFTPSVGLRVGYSGLRAKGWGTANEGYAREASDNLFEERFNVSFLHADLMWNLSHALSGYKETRRWNFLPFIGFGWAHSGGNGLADNEAAVCLGLSNQLRINDLLDLTLELRQLFVNERFDQIVGGSRYEGMTSVTVGLAFKLNRSGFRRAESRTAPDCTAYIRQIETLEQEKSQLASRNETLEAENRQLSSQTSGSLTAAGAGAAAPVALFFAPGHTTLDKRELSNLSLYIEHVVKADPEKIITLTGAIEGDAGSASARRLGEERVQYVHDLLVNWYGIPADRLRKQLEPSGRNRFGDPDLSSYVVLE